MGNHLGNTEMVTVLSEKSETNTLSHHHIYIYAQAALHCIAQPEEFLSATKNHINTISKQFNFNGIKCAT